MTPIFFVHSRRNTVLFLNEDEVWLQAGARLIGNQTEIVFILFLSKRSGHHLKLFWDTHTVKVEQYVEASTCEPIGILAMMCLMGLFFPLVSK